MQSRGKEDMPRRKLVTQGLESFARIRRITHPASASKGPPQSKVWLPAAHRDVVDADEDEILELDLVWPRADSPSRVRIIFHWLTMSLLDEPLDTLCDVFGQLGARDRARWAAKVFCRNLSAPLPVSRPLEPDGYTGATTFKDSFIPL